MCSVSRQGRLISVDVTHSVLLVLDIALPTLVVLCFSLPQLRVALVLMNVLRMHGVLMLRCLRRVIFLAEASRLEVVKLHVQKLYLWVCLKAVVVAVLYAAAVRLRIVTAIAWNLTDISLYAMAFVYLEPAVRYHKRRAST